MTDGFIPMILPTQYNEMESYIVENKVKLTEQVISSVYYALDKNLSSVEVFRFKNSDFIVVLEYSTFKHNIENIFNFYIETEQYEFCDRVIKLRKLLETHEQKKEQNKRYKSQSSSKRKT